MKSSPSAPSGGDRAGGTSAVPPTPAARLGALLGETRRRLRRWALRRGLLRCAAFLALSALCLLLGGAAVGPSPLWRPLCGAWLAAQAALLLYVVYQARRVHLSDEAVARYIGARVPDLRSDLLSAVELSRPRAAGAPAEADPFAAAFIDELCLRTVAAAASLPPERLVDRADPLRTLGVPGGVLLFSLLIALSQPALLLRGGRALLATPPDPTTPSSEPLVGDIRILYTYPRYTGLPQRTIPGSSGEVLALPGTTVRLEARSLGPVEHAQLIVEVPAGGGPAAQKPRPVQIVRSDGDRRPASGHPLLVASFPVTKAGRYYFVIERARGDRVREGDGHRIEIEPDRPPRIDLFAPAEDLEISPSRRVELAYSAEDDLGLGEIDLVFRAGEGPERRKRIRSVGPDGGKDKDKDRGKGEPQKAAAPQRTAAAKIEWDLAELDLKPGARVAYHLEARDLDDVSGPNKGVSRTYYLRVTSPREKHEAALGRQEALREQAIALLADRLELIEPQPQKQQKGEGAPELPERVLEVHRKGEAFLVEIGRVQEELPKDPMAPKELRGALSEMGKRLGKLSHDEEALLTALRGGQGQGAKRRSPRDIAQHNDRHVTELERDVLLLDDLLGRQRLEQLLGITDEMNEAKARLKQLLSDYKKTRSEATKREIEREIRELERRLGELADKARSLQGEVPDEFLNSEAMGRNDMQGRLDKLRDLLEKGDIDKALAELDRLSQSLDNLQKGLEGDLKGFRRERFTAEDKALSEAEDRLADLSHDQEMLRRETEGLKAEASSRARQLLRDRAQDLSKRLQEKVQKLRKQVQDVDIGPLGPWGSDELDKAHKRVEDLGRMLDQGDLDEARAMAQEAEGSISRLIDELRAEEQAVRPSQRQGLQRSRGRLEGARPLAREIGEEIGRALPQRGELLSPEKRKRMNELRAAQEALRKRAGDLGKEVQRKAKDTKDAPLLERLSQEMGEALRKADSHMGEASEQLKQLSPRGASSEQGQAQEQLDQLRKQMQKARRPKDEGGGGKLDREPVKIPGADEYRAPKEFRQDILDAAKREAPPEYRDQVKRYYEELVK